MYGYDFHTLTHAWSGHVGQGRCQVDVWRGWGSIAGGCIGSQLLHDADETRDRLAQVGDLLLQVVLDGHGGGRRGSDGHDGSRRGGG